MDLLLYGITTGILTFLVALSHIILGRLMTEYANVLNNKLDDVLKETQEIKSRQAFSKKRELETNKMLVKIQRKVGKI